MNSVLLGLKKEKKILKPDTFKARSDSSCESGDGESWRRPAPLNYKAPGGHKYDSLMKYFSVNVKLAALISLTQHI